MGSPHHPAHLAAQVCDAIDELLDYQRAFEAVESLITPTTARTAEDLSTVDRVNLGWLFLVLNKSMRDQIAKASSAAEASRSNLAGDARVN